MRAGCIMSLNLKRKKKHTHTQFETYLILYLPIFTSYPRIDIPNFMTNTREIADCKF